MPELIDFPEPTLIAVNGVELEVFEARQENAGNPIVLCHGWPEHAFSWRHQVPALAAAGYHVIVPNQRGYGNSTRPTNVAEYDIAHLSGDLVRAARSLRLRRRHVRRPRLGCECGVGAEPAASGPREAGDQLEPAVPRAREQPWIEFMEAVFGDDFYFVHFNRQPGVADVVLDENAFQFLRNLYRKNLPLAAPAPGMMMINLARAETPLGEPVMSDRELAVFVSAFQSSGFTGGINWYRNMDRNWHLLADVEPIIQQPALMITGLQDAIPKSQSLKDFVPNVDEVDLDCGHWIQQERPQETTQAILTWLEQQDAT